MLGGLVRFMSGAQSDNYQPMNANWGLVPAIAKRRGLKRRERREQAFRRGLDDFRGWLREEGFAETADAVPAMEHAAAAEAAA